MKTELATFETTVSVGLDWDDRQAAMRALNLHHLGDEQCNVEVDGKFVAKYPDKETPELKESHYSVCRQTVIRLKIHLMSDGTLTYETINDQQA